MRLIEVQRATTAPNDHGTPVDVWQRHKTLRAELVEQSTGEFLSAGGEVARHAAVFRTRYVDDVTTDDRILFKGAVHDIEVIVELGREQGLEWRCFTNGGGRP